LYCSDVLHFVVFNTLHSFIVVFFAVSRLTTSKLFPYTTLFRSDLLVIGNTNSPMFPKELLPYTKERKRFGKGGINLNFLVNYDWKWDVRNIISLDKAANNPIDLLKSKDI